MKIMKTPVISPYWVYVNEYPEALNEAGEYQFVYETGLACVIDLPLDTAKSLKGIKKYRRLSEYTAPNGFVENKVGIREGLAGKLVYILDAKGNAKIGYFLAETSVMVEDGFTTAKYVHEVTEEEKYNIFEALSNIINRNI
jgi:hypothetical protein